MKIGSTIRWGLGLLGAAWGVCLVLGPKAADLLAGRFGPALVQFSKGKIQDTSNFLLHRFYDLLFLTSGAFVLSLIGFWLFRLVERVRVKNRWPVQSLIVFALVNIWFWLAGQTPLFWSLMKTQGISNYTQYQFKKNLISENRIPKQAVLLGSSQMLAQVDEILLNQSFTNRLWTTELAFPGTTAFELLCQARRLRGMQAGIVICYVSEQSFYLPLQSEGLPYFFSIRDLLMLKKLGAGSRWFQRNFLYGILGDVLPVFRYRRELADRILGPGSQNLGQINYDAALESDLPARAQKMKSQFSTGPEAEIHKKAFTKFVAECIRQNRRLIVLEGQLNPILETNLDPSIRPDMKAFLKLVADQNPSVQVVSSNLTPEQPAAVYKDLTHVDEAAQARYSRWLIEFLENNPVMSGAGRD